MSRRLTLPGSSRIQDLRIQELLRTGEDDDVGVASQPSYSAPSLGSVPPSPALDPRLLPSTGIDDIIGLRAALDGKASQELASNDPNYAAYRTRFGTTVSQGSLEIREMVPALGGGRSVHVALGAWTAQAWTSDDFLPSDFAPAAHTHTLASLGAAAASHQHGDADLTDLSWGKLTGVPSTFTPSSHDHTFDSLTAKPTTLAGYGIVDAALASHTHDYSGVFASISHGHLWADITSKPAAFPPEAHAHTWESVTGKPSSFTPAAHSHGDADLTGLAWSKLTDVPATFTPSSHTHTTSEVTEGTNLYFAEARVRSTVLTGLNTSLTGAVSASDTILAAIGKLESRVAGFSASGVSSFNTRTGAVTLTSGDVTGALGFSPSPDTHTHPASSITNTPAGNIAATTVQAAINELDSEKGGLSTTNSWTAMNDFSASGVGMRVTSGSGGYSAVQFQSASDTIWGSFGTFSGDVYFGRRNPRETGTLGDIVVDGASGDVLLGSTTDSSSSSTGSVTTLGGAGVAKTLYVGESVRASGFRATAPAAAAGANAIWFDFATTTGRFVIVGPNSTTFAPFQFNQYSSDLSLFMLPMEITASGVVSMPMTTASTATTNGALVVGGGVGCGDYFTGKYRSSDGSAGITATRTFYAASSNGGATNVLNTVTIKDGIITSWTQA